MNRLQKRAWINLVAVSLFVLISALGVVITVHLNLQRNLTGLISFFAVALIAGLITYLRNIKSWEQFDEREKKILQKAVYWSMSFFILFMCSVSFAVFYIVGAINSVPAYILPVLCLFGIFLMVFIQSAVVLIQFTREHHYE